MVKRKSKRNKSTRVRRNKSRSKKAFSLTSFLMQKKILLPLIIIFIIAFMFGSGVVSFSATDARLILPEGWGNLFDFNLFEGLPTVGVGGLIVFLLVVVIIIFTAIWWKTRGWFAAKGNARQRSRLGKVSYDSDDRSWLGKFKPTGGGMGGLEWGTPGRDTRGRFEAIDDYGVD